MNRTLRPTQWRFLAVCAALTLMALGATACTSPLMPIGMGTTTNDVAAPAAEATDAAALAEATTEATEEAAAEVAPAEAAAPTVPDVVTGEYKGIPVGFTADGYPFRGDPEAPVTMIEYSDFQCPFCARYFVQTEPAINDNFIRDGQLRVIFRDYPIVELHPNAPAAHVASLCAADQSAVLYWEMHDKLFQTQAEWGNATDPAANFERLAEESSADMDAFKACMADMASKQPLIDAALVEGQAIGVSGTPSFQLKAATGDPYLLVGAQPYEEFAAYVGALAKGEAPPVPAEQAQAEPQELPLWATPDGWKPDPDRPGFNVSGDQYMGNPEAKAVVLEFTDFQCPYCRQHALETQPTLNEKFVDTGDVLWIFRHYPLSFHPQAEAASVAAECAADQGQFWEMKKLLFDEQENWSVDEPKSKFMELAGQLSLDAAKFEVCIDDPATLENIQGDRDSVQLNGTPTFVIFVDGQLAGQPIGGALPTETFVDVMQQVVEQANK